MSNKPMPRWSKDTAVVIRDASFVAGRGPGYIEVAARYGDLCYAELCPPSYIAQTTEGVLRKLAQMVGNQAVLA